MCSNATSKPRRPKKSRPLRPTSPSRQRLGFGDERAAPLMAFVLKLPHSPLSPVTTMTSVRLSGRRSRTVEKRMQRRIDAPRQPVQHALHLRRIRARVHDALLRAAQLRRGDHLHRLRDLLRVLHRAHAAPEVNE